MEKWDINIILERKELIIKIKEILLNFNKNKNDPLFKKGIYIYGEPGSGKTSLVVDLLNEMNYDIIKYDAGDIRNKSIIDTITSNNISDKNVLSMFQQKVKKIVIVMDEIDGMNNGDKGGINTLIKLIRPKKTKKQKYEEVTSNPIICIGNYHIDKKIKELMKVCNVFELKSPSSIQIMNIIKIKIPIIEINLLNNIVEFVQNDLRKLNIILNIHKNKPDFFEKNKMNHIFQMKSYNEDTKQITHKLINQRHSIHEHLSIMNETDRTIVGLLWHENIIDLFGKMKKEQSVIFYLKLLENICYADYIDRITFQKQIWQFNEMSSLIKTFQNNNLLHDTFKKKIKYNLSEIRFTKVLTKYSTEYNNSLFIQNLCQQLNMDKKDLYAFFIYLQNKYSEAEMIQLFENYEITKLDINRIFRFIDKFTKEDIAEDDEILEEDVNLEEN